MKAGVRKIDCNFTDLLMTWNFVESKAKPRHEHDAFSCRRDWKRWASASYAWVRILIATCQWKSRWKCWRHSCLPDRLPSWCYTFRFGTVACTWLSRMKVTIWQRREIFTINLHSWNIPIILFTYMPQFSH